MSAILRYLGHGRALETFLGVLKILIGITLMFSNLSERTPSLADIAWSYSNAAIASPFLIVGVLQFSGAVFNMLGHEWSWRLRCVGAFFAILMWSIFLSKSSLIGQSSFVLPLALACLPASAFLLYKSWNRLPIPGAAGMV